jgi:hypothetical protein
MHLLRCLPAVSRDPWSIGEHRWLKFHHSFESRGPEQFRRGYGPPSRPQLCHLPRSGENFALQQAVGVRGQPWFPRTPYFHLQGNIGPFAANMMQGNGYIPYGLRPRYRQWPYPQYQRGPVTHPQMGMPYIHQLDRLPGYPAAPAASADQIYQPFDDNP